MLYEAERGDITIAVVGDAMLSRRLRAFREPHFLKLVELLRNAERARQVRLQAEGRAPGLVLAVEDLCVERGGRRVKPRELTQDLGKT